MKKNFMMKSNTAKKLYKEIENLPIIDYHCHLNIKEIFEDKPYDNLCQIWLYADHYKWRQMRTFGIAEEYVTGTATDYQKFEKYMEMLCYAIGQPLYAWSKMELEKYFDIVDEILPDNIQLIWQKANAVISEKQLSPKKLIEMSNVEAVCIIEDISADLSIYNELESEKVKYFPVLRGDKLLDKAISLEKIKEIFPDILAKFINAKCKSADFGIEGIAQDDFLLIEKLSYMMEVLYKNNFAVQLHFSPMRNNNAKMFKLVGADKGFDSISEKPYIDGLVKVFNNITDIGKTILFNLNPEDCGKLAAFCGNYVGGGIAGKVQPGAAWWFNDTAAGMRKNLETICDYSLLSTFIGMLTDSRSYISYTRHDYFRRILCEFVGDIAERGEFTSDDKILGKIVADVSYYNVKKYLDL